MVDERLKKIISSYSLDVSVESNSNITHLVTLTSKSVKGLSIHIRYVNDQIYSVFFLNCDFFEITETDLYAVVESILKGSYRFKSTGLFKRRRYVQIIADKFINPENINKDKEFIAYYGKLPAAF